MTRLLRSWFTPGLIVSLQRRSGLSQFLIAMAESNAADHSKSARQHAKHRSYLTTAIHPPPRSPSILTTSSNRSDRIEADAPDVSRKLASKPGLSEYFSCRPDGISPSAQSTCAPAIPRR